MFDSPIATTLNVNVRATRLGVYRKEHEHDDGGDVVVIAMMRVLVHRCVFPSLGVEFLLVGFFLSALVRRSSYRLPFVLDRSSFTCPPVLSSFASSLSIEVLWFRWFRGFVVSLFRCFVVSDRVIHLLTTSPPPPPPRRHRRRRVIVVVLVRTHGYIGVSFRLRSTPLADFLSFVPEPSGAVFAST